MVNRTQLIETARAELEAANFKFRHVENEWWFVTPNGSPSPTTYLSEYAAIVAANNSLKQTV